MKTQEIVNEIFYAALKAVDPFFIVKKYADKICSDFIRKQFKNLFIIGFGKASYQMAKAVAGVFDASLISSGIVITKYGHVKSRESGVQNLESGVKDLQKIKVYEAGHPIPDRNGLKATEEIINLLKDTDKDTLILCLISGGGSSLFVSPYGGIKLSEKQLVTDLLLRAGADISALNVVRKHISKIKGGRLVKIAYPAKIISLIISDVIADKLDIIASGPTAPDLSTYQDAIDVVNKFNLSKKLPPSVMEVLNKGRKGIIPDTPKQDNPVFKNIQNIIISNNQKALEGAKGKAQSLRLNTEIISSNVTGESRDVGKWLASKAIEARNALCVRDYGKKICLVSGGETTVTVKGKGKGGRNLELALSFAIEIEGINGITLLSGGTDGTDGPTDAAGAIVDGKTITKAKDLGLNPQEYLNNNDSYNFFKKINSLLITGPTGTNVMDVQIMVIE